MPSVESALPYAPHYILAEPTKEAVDYADLAILDFANFDSDKETLVEHIKRALAPTGPGFFYVVNHGYTSNQMERIFDIADISFSQVSNEEKKLYEGTMKATGSFQGYKPRQYWHVDNGVLDQVETYNINRDVTRRTHPVAIRPYLPEIEQFAKHCHFNLLHRICRLLALGLNLPEESFVNLHGFDAVGESYVRFMKYYPRTEQDEIQSNNVWLKGHTDIGTITLLCSQPITALQILSPSSQWNYVKYIPNAFLVNAGDMMEFLSGGRYKATIHRVVQPPVDQRGKERLGVFYFSMTNDDVMVGSVVPGDEEDGKEKVTMESWRKARTAAYGKTALKKLGQDGKVEVEDQTIGGKVVRHYN